MSNLYEVKLARGKTIEDFEASINGIASIRRYEIDESIESGFDVVDFAEYWFKPESPVNFVNGEYHQVWMRQKP